MTYSTDMLADGPMRMLPSEDVLTNLFAVVFLVALCYAAGRLHEFSRRVSERELAFQEGYNRATKSLFSLATRATKGLTIERSKPVPAMRGAAAVPRAEPETEVVRLPGPNDTMVQVPEDLELPDVQPIRGRHSAGKGKSTMQRRRLGPNPWKKAKNAA